LIKNYQNIDQKVFYELRNITIMNVIPNIKIYELGLIS